MNISDLKKRFEANFANRKVVQGIWDELERYVVPYRGRMFMNENNEGSVEWDKYNHYDDTAVVSAQTLSASMHGSILPQLQWFNMKFNDQDIQNVDENANWLSEAARRTYKAIDESNFSLESDELFLDLAGFGHGFQVSESGGADADDLSFSMIPLKEAYFEEDENGVPVYFFRRLQWSATKIVAKFGIENVPEIVKTKYENAQNVDEKIEVIFAIFPRKDKKDADTTKPLIPKERPIGHVYFLRTSEDTLGDEGGYYENPVYSVRWRKVSGSQWGHGPGHIALGDIKQVNQHRLMRTRAVEKALDPANITTERGLMSNLDLGPRGLTVVRDMDSLRPYEGKANFSISSEELVIMKQAIKQAFRVDQLELKESPAMTATEVQVRYELMQRLLGPTLGRIKVDWLNRVVKNVFNIELRAGRLPPMPEALQGTEMDIEIEYIGAMATAQKSQLANDMIEWAAGMGNLAELYPNLKYVVNDIELGREVARLKNIPEKIINGEDKIKADRAADEKAMQRRRLLEQAAAEGAANKAVGEGKQAMNEANNATIQ